MTDPRAQRSRTRITAAARALMSENGPEAVTFAAVAERAGVGRATVYRHWTTTDELVDEVMDEFSLPFFRNPGEPLDDWLRGELRRLADELATPAVVRMTTSLIAQDRDPTRRDQLFDTLENRLAAVLPPGPHRSEQASLLIGPLLYLSLARRHRVTDEWIAHLVSSVL